MARTFLLIFLFQLISLNVLTQSRFGFDQIPVKSYTRNSYKAGNQNWSICQDKKGIMYIGNNNGLLVFNGHTWKLYSLPNHTTVRSVASDKNGRIYVGSFQEFGYFEADEFGILHYNSLSSLLKDYTFHNEEFWKIIIHNDDVYFQYFTVIFKYSKGKVETIFPNGFISCFTKINNRLITDINGRGLFELKNNQFKLISDNSFFKTKEISTILEYDKNSLLIGTTQDGMYLFNEQNGLSFWKADDQQLLRHDQVNRGLITKDGKIILGTILNGIYIFNHEGLLLQHINRRNGLQNNTVLNLYSDINNNVWVGLDRGIDLLILNSDISFFHDFNGKIGSVYALLLKNNDLYIGTNQGLYMSPVPESEDKPVFLDFSFIDGSQGQVWTIYDAGKQILFGHNRGTYDVENNKISMVSSVSGGFSYETFNLKGREYLLGSTYTKLAVYERIGDKWKFRNAVEGFMHPVRQIKIDYQGNIWASHFVKGLYRLRLNDLLNVVEQMVYYGKDKGFISDYQINVAQVQNRVVFINQGELFTYNDLLDSIVPYTKLTDQIGIKLKIKYISQSENGRIWIIAEQGIFEVQVNIPKWKILKSYPSDLFYDKVISGQEFILPLNNGDAILALDNGLAYIKSDSIPPLDSITIKPILTNVISIGRTEFQLPISQTGKKNLPVLPHWNNSLIFQYAFPNYHSSSYFMVKLNGLDTKWIRTEMADFKYDRIPAGDYTFMIKAVDSKGLVSDTVEWSFVVKPAWYTSAVAKVLYVAFIIGLLVFVRYYYKKRLINQTRRMKIEKERELIRLRNEKLEAEVTHKSKELANTTFSIIKKNELLIEIRKLLMIQKKQSNSGQIPKFTSIVRLLDRNISNDDDWKIFESNFEQAHEEFLKRIREQFPDLTPSDLKLSAYLRMNLSSKKIALLLGITIRGVENHRYRLRKKIGLEHDSNLIEYLMGF